MSTSGGVKKKIIIDESESDADAESNADTPRNNKKSSAASADDDDSKSTTSSASIAELELGDIIEIVAETNDELNDTSFIIDYIDETKIRIIHLENLTITVLNVDASGNFKDESITEIHLLSRSETKGYARQHELLPKTWLNVEFGGDVPFILTGQITDLEEDTIEITQYPSKEVFYIDFEYKGIPESLPIRKIEIRDPPDNISADRIWSAEDDVSNADTTTNSDDASASASPSFTILSNGESVIKFPDPDDLQIDKDYTEELQELYLDANELFGEELDIVYQTVELPDTQKRFTVELQLNDLTDELLANNDKNRQNSSRKIHYIVERFKELREMFSKFDRNGYIYDVKKYGETYIPLIDRLTALDTVIPWILPVVTQKNKLYNLRGTDNENDAIIINNGNDEIAALENYIEDYNKNKVVGNESKYQYLMNKLSNYFTPFHNNIDLDNATSYLQIQKPVLANIETIVNNDGQYYSTVSQLFKASPKKPATFSKYKYYLQKYLTPQRQQSSRNESAEVIRGDYANVQSLLFMPKSIVAFSTSNSMTANLLSKCNTGVLYYSQLLTQNTVVAETQIDISIGAGGKGTARADTSNNYQFLKGIRNFYIQDDASPTSNTSSITENDYKMFLHRILENNGKPSVLLRKFRNKSSHAFTLCSLLQIIEPFFYYTHNISNQEYTTIVKKYLNKNIKEYLQKMYNTREHILSWRKLTTTRFNPRNEIYFMFNVSAVMRGAEIMKSIKDHYVDEAFINETTNELNYAAISASQLLHEIHKTDYGVLYCKYVQFSMLGLTVPDEIMSPLILQTTAPSATANESQQEKLAKEFSDCNNKKSLAKRYTTEQQLSNDGNAASIKTIYFDKDLDNAPYFIVKNSKQEKNKYDSNTFQEYITELLKNKYKYEDDFAKYTAKIICKGEARRPVEDGHYALLERVPQKVGSKAADAAADDEADIESRARKENIYFKRIGNTWVRDDDLTKQNMAFTEASNYFCNIRENPTHSEFKKKTAQKIEMSLQEIQTNLSTEIENQKKFILLQKHYIFKEMNRRNFIANELGKYIEDAPDKTTVSPYAQLLDKIIAQEDFAKRLLDTCTFKNLFCREAITGADVVGDGFGIENPHWLYCKETNTPLLPMSLFILANTFTYNKEQYPQKLNEVCAEYGQLSDDGESEVDRYSGRVLRRIDFISEEGYDKAGFRIVTGAVIEKDIGQIAKTILTTDDDTDRGGANKMQGFKFKQDQQTQIISNIIHSVSEQIGVPLLDNREEFIISTVINIINNPSIIETEDRYKQKIIKAKRENQRLPPPYIIYKNQRIMLTIGCILLVSIQTSIPSFKTKKTFPGCVQSFAGFPLDDYDAIDEDAGEAGANKKKYAGLNYIACVFSKMKSKIEPWNSIELLNHEHIFTRMCAIFNIILEHNNEVIELYNIKREYIANNPSENDTPIEHDIRNWTQFHPPLVKYKLNDKSLKQTAAQFDDDFKAAINTGNPMQHSYFLTYYSKNMFFSYFVINAINKVVFDKGVIMKTITQIPFLENACCTNNNGGFESLMTNPVYYFKTENKEIEYYLNACSKNETVIRNITKLSKPLFLFNDENYAYKYVKISENYSDINMYAAFIHYCNFDNQQPIPTDLLSICKEKPKTYNDAEKSSDVSSIYPTSKTILEKMEYLKKHGKQFSLQKLYDLMMVINNRNRVGTATLTSNDQLNSANSANSANSVNILKEIVNHLDNKSSIIIEENYRIKLMDVIDNYKDNVYYKEDDFFRTEMSKNNKYLTAVLNLRDYLLTINNNLHKIIIRFIKTHGNITKNELDKIEDYILKMMHRKSAANNAAAATKTDSESNHESNDFLYTIINFMKNIIYRFSKVYPNILINGANYNYIPRHWGLSEKHNNDIRNFIANMFDDLKKYNLDENLLDLFETFKQEIDDINLFIQNVPVFSPIHAENTTFYKFLNKDTTNLIYMNAWYSTICHFIELVNDPDIIRKNINLQKKQNNDTVEDLLRFAPIELATDADTDLIGIQLDEGNAVELKQKACFIILGIMKIEEKNKQYIQMSYDEISGKMNKTKEAEKKKITDFFENMQKDERYVENQLKKYKIGKWNVGMQRGLFIYDKNVYDNEIDGGAGLSNDIESSLGAQFADFEADALIDDDGAAADVRDVNDLEDYDKRIMQKEIDDEYGLDGVVNEEDYDDYDEY